MKKKSYCNCHCTESIVKSDNMVHPVPLSDLKSCNCKNNNLKKDKDGSFIDYNNTTFSNKGPIAYGEEADSDDL
ncbi:MAG: hypothetical protein ACRDAU_07500 [Clostridium sp.]